MDHRPARGIVVIVIEHGLHITQGGSFSPLLAPSEKSVERKIAMRKDDSIRTFLLGLLVLTAMTCGCGGEGTELNPNPSAPPATEASGGNQMQGPVLGFVYTVGGMEARAINGVPGGSSLGLPLPVPAGVTSLAFAPGQKYALAEQTEGASLGLMAFAGAEPGALVQIAGTIPKPDVISFSPKGAAAALYSAPEGQLQVITGLPRNPQLSRQMTSGELPSAVRLLAIADDGATLLAGTANNSVYLLGSGGAQLLESVSSLGGMVFTPQSNDALIFDSGAGTLSLLHEVSGAHSSRVLAQGLTGLTGNLAVGTDGRHAVITTSNASHLWEIDLASQAVQEVQLPTPPTMLLPLRLSGHFLLAWQPDEPAWILNTNPAEGAVYFVPAAHQAAQEARSAGH